MFSIILLSAAMGWCGTPYPGWWWHIIHRPVPPHPDPDAGPYRAFSDPMPGIFGIIGGIAAGYAVHTVFPNESLVLIALCALAGGRILSDIGGAFIKTKRV